MKLSKNWLKILATVNLILFFTLWIVIISLGEFLALLPIKYYYFFMLLSSVSAYLRRIELATILQLIGCFIFGSIFFLQTGIAMAFNSLNFWDLFTSSPFHALEFFSFFGFCVIAAVLLIFEYRKYNTKKTSENFH
ncbi:MAG: hypothetical protein KGD65_14345 [Candidatus Lokiarchaeota archaeon]|nr:hypothetical protein [Candidatus Lokiarchaeota archaeon]